MKNLHKLITNDQYDIGGLCTEPKGNVIKSLVMNSNAKLCVEIGVFKGSSLLYFAEALQETGGKVIGIDPYEIGSLKNEIPNKQETQILTNCLLLFATSLRQHHRHARNVFSERPRCRYER